MPRHALLFAAVCLLCTTGAAVGRTYPSGSSAGRGVSAPGQAIPSAFPSHAGRPAAAPANTARLTATFARLPLRFEANRGQTDARVKFLARGAGYTLFLTANEAVLSLAGNAECKVRSAKCGVGRYSCGSQEEESFGNTQRPTPNTQHATRNTQHAIRMRLVGSNSAPRVAGGSVLAGRSNYFIGSDPRKWRTDVPAYAQVRYQGVYPHTDMVYYGSQGRLEYDFVLHPGADPKRISLAFDGADRVAVDAAGNLVLHAGDRQVRFRKPVVHQEIAGRRTPVAGGYTLAPSRKPGTSPSVGFRVAAYDRARPLVVDPVLEYATYLGGTDDALHSLAVDGTGAAYVAGHTSSTDFPATPGALETTYFGGPEDAFVAKIAPDGGALQYATYLGGSEAEDARALAVDATGAACVAGCTLSTDLPTTARSLRRTPPGGSEGFIARIRPDGGGLEYATYVGGSSWDSVDALAVGATGDVSVAGYTSSVDFPATPGALDLGDVGAFVARLSPDGSSIAYAAHLGDTASQMGPALAVDAAGAAYLCGWVSGADLGIHNAFAATSGAFDTTYGGGMDGWVAKVRPDGSALEYAAFLGGSADDIPHAIAVDACGAAYVAGSTLSADFPVTPTAFGRSVSILSSGAFVVKVSPDGRSLRYAGSLGGSVGQEAYALALDQTGAACVAGTTNSDDFPTTPDALARSICGRQDAFVARIRPDGSALDYATYLGGSGYEIAFGLAVDPAGCIYVAGHTASEDFPTTPNAFDRTLDGRPMFIAKFGPNGPPSRLKYLSPPTHTPAGPLPALRVAIADAAGTTVKSATTPITLTLAGAPAGVALAGTTTVSAVNGVATFRDVRIYKAGTYTLTAGAAGLEPATSGAFTITAGAARRLGFGTQPPPRLVAGPALAPAVRVAVQDVYRNTVPGATNRISLALSAGTTWAALSGTTSADAVDGVATFSDLSAGRIGTGFRLSAGSDGLAAANSSPFTVVTGAPARLAFKVQPSGVAAMAPITPAVKISLLDNAGNVVTTANHLVTVALGANPAGGTLSGTLTARAAAGVATFANLRVDKAGAGYTLSAASGTLQGVSAQFHVAVGPPTGVAFVVQPYLSTAGAPIAPAVKVAMQDAGGNTVTTAAGVVTLALGAHPAGAVLSGATTANATRGVATFPCLRINRSGRGYTLRAAVAGLAGATSTAFDVLAGRPARLVFLRQPSNANVGEPVAPAVQVAVQDAQGNRVPGATNAVTLSLPSNHAGAILSGAALVPAADGVATFADLKVSRAGNGYLLRAAAEGLWGVYSARFNIAALPPARLFFQTLPASGAAGAPITPAIAAGVSDRNGTPIFTPVRVTLTAAGRAYAAYTSNGIALFPTATIYTAGQHPLTLAAPGLPTAAAQIRIER